MHRLHLPPSQRGDGPLAAGGVSKVGTSKIKEFQVEGRTKAKCFFRGILLFLLFLLFAAPANASPRIDSVKATVTSSEAIPSPVTARMETSIEAIAGQLLLGKPADMPAADAAKQAVLIREVFDKVLVGYTVTDAEVVPGETARVQVTLVPWADRVQSVAVETQVDGMTPEVESMVRQDLAGVEQVFDRALIGLPIAAADWTNGVLKREVNAYLAEHLPEFRADFDVTADTNAQVKLTVYPRVPVVRTVDLSMRSDTMPNVLLLTHRELLKDRVNVLVGVPVAFTERHRAAFEQLFADAVDQQPDFTFMRMKTDVTLKTGERAEVMARTDSSRYRLRLTGWLDVGRDSSRTHSDEEDLLVRLHAGRRFSRVDELYLLTDVTPQDVEWRWQLGWSRDLGYGTRAGLRYDFKAHRPVYDFGWQIAPDWLLRYEYHNAGGYGEGAIRYRIHDFLSVEYACDNEGGWLRFLGNF